MADNPETHASVGAWAKRYHLANRAAIESILRPYDLGSTQWAVVYQLAHDGAMVQRDLGRILNIERATLSAIVTTLVRKGLVEQRADTVDQRQRILELTEAGRNLWANLPDPVAVSQAMSFEDADPDDLAVAVRVLQRATERLTQQLQQPST
ncbi:MarR family winged helix-turn-helix transcriptional regulator [Microbacterium deminutum]|uniref:HTH marR-type domain-containing protein n=1 Tax=Microbacterium deminutum TaxID=344164 RepID=A0ABN2QAV4_9MICO